MVESVQGSSHQSKKSKAWWRSKKMIVAIILIVLILLLLAALFSLGFNCAAGGAGAGNGDDQNGDPSAENNDSDEPPQGGNDHTEPIDHPDDREPVEYFVFRFDDSDAQLSGTLVLPDREEVRIDAETTNWSRFTASFSSTLREHRDEFSHVRMIYIVAPVDDQGRHIIRERPRNDLEDILVETFNFVGPRGERGRDQNGVHWGEPPFDGR